MSKKILGVVAAGMLSGIGSIANATIVTPAYNSELQSFSYSGATIGQFLTIGVSDVSGDTTGNSILNLSSLDGLNLLGGAGIYSMSPLVLETGQGDAMGGTACNSYVQSPGPAVGGDCSVFVFEITKTTVSWDWQMAQWDSKVTTVNGIQASDFAFFAMSNGIDGGIDGYLIPSLIPPSGSGNSINDVPEPSAIALLGIGLLGAGIAIRRRRSY